MLPSVFRNVERPAAEDVSLVSRVQMTGHTFGGGDLKECEYLLVRRTGCVVDAEADTHGTVPNRLQCQRAHCFDLFGGCRCITIRRADRFAKFRVTHCRRVVNQGTHRCMLPSVFRNVERPAVHAKNRRHTITDFELVRFLVQAHAGEDVDKSGRHDLPAGVDSPAALDVIRGDRPNLVRQDADVSDLVPPRLRVYHPTPEDHRVIKFLSNGRRRQNQGQKKNRDQRADAHVCRSHEFCRNGKANMIAACRRLLPYGT